MTKPRTEDSDFIIYQNYDLYEDGTGIGPGGGLHSGEYKSVKDFLKNKRKRKKKVRALLLSFLTKTATDYPLDSQVTPIISEESSYQASLGPGGMYDSLTPEPDEEDKSPDKLNFGRDYADQEVIEKEDPGLTPAQPNWYGENSLLTREELDSLYDQDPRYGIGDFGTNIYEIS